MAPLWGLPRAHKTARADARPPQPPPFEKRRTPFFFILDANLLDADFSGICCSSPCQRHASAIAAPYSLRYSCANAPSSRHFSKFATPSKGHSRDHIASPEQRYRSAIAALSHRYGKALLLAKSQHHFSIPYHSNATALPLCLISSKITTATPRTFPQASGRTIFSIFTN